MTRRRRKGPYSTKSRASLQIALEEEDEIIVTVSENRVLVSMPSSPDPATFVPPPLIEDDEKLDLRDAGSSDSYLERSDDMLLEESDEEYFILPDAVPDNAGSSSSQAFVGCLQSSEIEGKESIESDLPEGVTFIGRNEGWSPEKNDPNAFTLYAVPARKVKGMYCALGPKGQPSRSYMEGIVEQHSVGEAAIDNFVSSGFLNATGSALVEKNPEIYSAARKLSASRAKLPAFTTIRDFNVNSLSKLSCPSTTYEAPAPRLGRRKKRKKKKKSQRKESGSSTKKKRKKDSTKSRKSRTRAYSDSSNSDSTSSASTSHDGTSDEEETETSSSILVPVVLDVSTGLGRRDQFKVYKLADLAKREIAFKRSFDILFGSRGFRTHLETCHSFLEVPDDPPTIFEVPIYTNPQSVFRPGSLGFNGIGNSSSLSELIFPGDLAVVEHSSREAGTRRISCLISDPIHWLFFDGTNFVSSDENATEQRVIRKHVSDVLGISKVEAGSLFMPVSGPCNDCSRQARCEASPYFSRGLVFRLLRSHSSGRRCKLYSNTEETPGGNSPTAELTDVTSLAKKKKLITEKPCAVCVTLLHDQFPPPAILRARPRSGLDKDDVRFFTMPYVVFSDGCATKSKRRNASIVNWFLSWLGYSDKNRSGRQSVRTISITPPWLDSTLPGKLLVDDMVDGFCGIEAVDPSGKTVRLYFIFLGQIADRVEQTHLSDVMSHSSIAGCVMCHCRRMPDRPFHTAGLSSSDLCLIRCPERCDALRISRGDAQHETKELEEELQFLGLSSQANVTNDAPAGEKPFLRDLREKLRLKFSAEHDGRSGYAKPFIHDYRHLIPAIDHTILHGVGKDLLSFGFRLAADEDSRDALELKFIRLLRGIGFGEPSAVLANDGIKLISTLSITDTARLISVAPIAFSGTAEGCDAIFRSAQQQKVVVRLLEQYRDICSLVYHVPRRGVDTSPEARIRAKGMKDLNKFGHSFVKHLHELCSSKIKNVRKAAVKCVDKSNVPRLLEIFQITLPAFGFNIHLLGELVYEKANKDGKDCVARTTQGEGMAVRGATRQESTDLFNRMAIAVGNGCGDQVSCDEEDRSTESPFQLSPDALADKKIRKRLNQDYHAGMYVKEYDESWHVMHKGKLTMIPSSMKMHWEAVCSQINENDLTLANFAAAAKFGDGHAAAKRIGIGCVMTALASEPEFDCLSEVSPVAISQPANASWKPERVNVFVDFLYNADVRTVLCVGRLLRRFKEKAKSQHSGAEGSEIEVLGLPVFRVTAEVVSLRLDKSSRRVGAFAVETKGEDGAEMDDKCWKVVDTSTTKPGNGSRLVVLMGKRHGYPMRVG